MAVPMTISPDVARRFLLGHEGLWPGRRWQGKSGTLTAVRELGWVQMDPVTIVARSHDLVLWSRVTDYRPDDLQSLLYEDRLLFDYGGVLRIQPIEELPHWRLHMERRRQDRRYHMPLLDAHPDLFDAVRAGVERDGPIPARVLPTLIDGGAAPVGVVPGGTPGSYRSQSILGRIAYQLWMTGELMTHHRQGFERHYDRADRIAPHRLLRPSDDATAMDYFARQVLANAGLMTVGSWRSAMAYALNRPVDRAEATARTEQLVADGLAITVAIDGVRGQHLALATAGPLLDALLAGEIPSEWRPAAASKSPTAFLLSPLDRIVTRARAKIFFGFDHLWEIYKPAEKRRWGPFTMPILYDDSLVGRVDPRMDRQTGTLHLNGVWLETPDLADDPLFVAALTRVLRDLARFLAAERIEPGATDPDGLARRLTL